MAKFSYDPVRADLLFDHEPNERDMKIALLLKGAIDCLGGIQRMIARYELYQKEVVEE